MGDAASKLPDDDGRPRGFPFDVGNYVAVLVPAVDPAWFAGELIAVTGDGIGLAAVDGTDIRLWVPWSHALTRTLTGDEIAEAERSRQQLAAQAGTQS